MSKKTCITSVSAAVAEAMQGTSALPGAKVPLSALWAEGAPSAPGTAPAPRATVLCFLRRLGCKICRVLAQDMEKLRGEVGAGARVVCLSYERLGEGSDADRSFTSGSFFGGEMYRVEQAEVYAPLFGRKGLLQGFGLGSLLTDKSGKLATAAARGTTGNLTGDGMQLGGLFVLSSAGVVLLDKRQAFFGDDATNEEVLAAIASCQAGAAPAAAGGGGSQ